MPSYDASVTEPPPHRRELVPFEVAAVIAIALIPLPIPRVVPLLVVASLSRWLRGTSWGTALHGGGFDAAIGAAAGVIALALALLAGTPLIESLTGHAIEWSTFPMVRGNSSQLFVVIVLVGVTALAAELVLHGWILDRMLELGRGGPVLPILVAAIAEGILTSGDLAARLGAGGFGAGLGWMYVASKRSLLAPTCARLAFQLGAVTLEALRIVG
ncbi:MAG: hypothetical protein JWO36_3404 [Myxococcales bacterium]|nr:hypothetical protein [Myxococcales bacterium]